MDEKPDAVNQALKDRHLFLPRGTVIPESVREICSASVDLERIRSRWNNAVHLAASVHAGHTSAVHVTARYGSASRGDPLYEAIRLLRTVFMCDYVLNDAFRRELLRVLNRGEARLIELGRQAAQQASLPGRSVDAAAIGDLCPPRLLTSLALPNTARVALVPKALDRPIFVDGLQSSVPNESFLRHVLMQQLVHVAVSAELGSTARGSCRSGVVVTRYRLSVAPRSPAARISRATRLRPTRMP